MASPYNDKSYLWIVWQRGEKQGQVRQVLGVYASKGDAMFQAQRAGADGLTPVKDRVMANLLIASVPGLLEAKLANALASA